VIWGPGKTWADIISFYSMTGLMEMYFLQIAQSLRNAQSKIQGLNYIQPPVFPGLTFSHM